MSKHLLLLIVGFLMMTAPAGISQVNAAKPAEPVERHLSSRRDIPGMVARLKSEQSRVQSEQ